jgi:hypothetical protein
MKFKIRSHVFSKYQRILIALPNGVLVTDVENVDRLWIIRWRIKIDLYGTDQLPGRNARGRFSRRRDLLVQYDYADFSDESVDIVMRVRSTTADRGTHEEHHGCTGMSHGHGERPH